MQQTPVVRQASADAKVAQASSSCCAATLRLPQIPACTCSYTISCVYYAYYHRIYWI